jgi:PncC family amidohydrolase
LKERQIKEFCSKHGYTVALAESCTGGLLSSRLTDIPGASEYFMGGVVAYNNDIKINILRVPFDIIYTYGAVSGRTALAMANGARKLFDTNLGIGITGICGPTGGTTAKPVGLVFIGGSFEDREIIKEFYFNGDRLSVRNSATEEALNMMLELLNSSQNEDESD